MKERVKKELREAKEMLSKVPSLFLVLLVLSLVSMNLLANKSIDLNLSWLALDMGIIISWVIFLVMDILVKVFGPKVSNLITVLAMGFNLMVVGVFAVASYIGGTWSQAYDYGEIANIALDKTFRGTWYVLLGSTVAFLVSALVNNGLNALIGKSLVKIKGSFAEFALRGWISTFIAQFIDNLVFALMVSKIFFGWTWLQCFMCALTGALAELVLEVVFSPIGHKLAKKISKDLQLQKEVANEAEASEQ